MSNFSALALVPEVGTPKVMRTFATTTPDGDRVVVTVPVTVCPVGYPKGLLTWDGFDPQSDLRAARPSGG